MSEQERTVLQLVLVNDTGDSFYRMRWPGAHVAEQASNWRVINLDAQAQERFALAEEADLLVLYQSNDVDLLPLLDRRRAAGKKTIAEYNDNFYSPPPASPVFKEWSSPLLWRTYEQFIEKADAVIVTGQGLKQLFSKKFNNNFIILENHFPQEPPPFEEYWPESSDEIILGWGGSLGHVSDILSLSALFHDLLREVPNLKIHLMGNEAVAEHLHLPPDRVRFAPWGSMADYFRFWKPVHLGVAPLLDTPYNRCRSDIKAVEMSALGVVPLLPNALPYRPFLKETGLEPYRSLSELKRRMKQLIKKPAEMRSEAFKCYEYVKENRVGPRRTERFELYQKFMPKNASNYSWPQKLREPKYYEVGGTAKPEAASVALVQQAQDKLKGGAKAEARAMLEHGLGQNPYDPSLTLSWVKLLRAIEDPSLPTELSKAKERFRQDLRFCIFELALTDETSAQEKIWKPILDYLAKAPPPEQAYYRDDLTRLILQKLRQDSALLPVVLKLQKLYPDSAALRFELARLLEREGKNDQALIHYRWLVKHHELVAQNRDFFEQATYTYFLSWQETLRARKKK